jgi:hypothetical protein
MKAADREEESEAQEASALLEAEAVDFPLQLRQVSGLLYLLGMEG